jgi:glycosyltransferase involved in cell wall biosynthesis
MTATDTMTRPEVSVIVPARNEEASLADCLESLVSQTGGAFEIIVVDDHSTDRTREIAQSFATHVASNVHGALDASSGGGPEARNASTSIRNALHVIEAGSLPEHWTGKNNAVMTGARAARGQWLLFTDADTVHLPGSLSRALVETRENNVDLLSYSPEQIAASFWEMAILPVVFAELARQYPPSKVSDPNSPIAAANGQYILIRREAYDAIGGHAAVAKEILEDVALARAVKVAGRKIRFRYAADAVRTRMYRNFAQLREGWTKNLALLFPNAGWLAIKMSLFWLIPIAALAAGRLGLPIAISGVAFLFLHIKRSNFSTIATILATFFGPPMFAYLLVRSKRAHGQGTVFWKGRMYTGEAPGERRPAIKVPPPIPKATAKLS